MPHGRHHPDLIDLASWVVVAFVGLITLAQALGRSGTAAVAVVQSLTPYLTIALVPVALVAALRRRLLIATVASAVGFGIAVLAAPLAFPGPQPAAAANATGVRVASLNLFIRNPEIDAVADVLATLDADVIVLVEYTREHQSALESSRVADDFPYRSDRSGGGSSGMGIWSRFPIEERDGPDVFAESIDVDVRGPDGDIRVIAAHLRTPIADFTSWRNELTNAPGIGRSIDGPTLLIGDLNSSYWHPPYRQLLDAGFVDAHTANGSGFSTSWPTGRWFPPFVRLDHALTAGGLVSTDVDDFEIPGSDHRGLVVTVAPAR